MKGLGRTMLFFLLVALFIPALARPRCAGAPADRETVLARIRALHARLEFAPRDSFLNYAIATLARRAEIDLRREGIRFPLMPLVTETPARRVDLFRLATGATALHESLQLSETLFPARPEGAKATVPLSGLGAPELPTLDFKQRLAEEAAAGHPSVPDPEARLVPGSGLYLRFGSGAELIAFLEESTAWMRHVLDFYGRGVRKADLLYRIFHHLGLPDPRQHVALYRALPGPLAVSVGDPFLVEGTDVTVILPEGVPAAFFPAHAGRCRASAGGRVILSTSARALARVKAVIETKTGALVNRPDYALLRAFLPFQEGEAFFCCFSEAFLRHLVGPRLRILESRRVRCASHLRTLVNASLLFLQERGRQPKSTQELLEGGYVTERILTCPHGGAYRLGKGMEPACSVHGTLARLTPLCDLDLSLVTEAEASAFRRFSRVYRNYWRRYFDPAAFKATRRGRSWHVEFAALPLARSSMYRNLAAFAGGRPLEGLEEGNVLPDTVFLLDTRVDPSFFRRLEARFARWSLVPEDWEGGYLSAAFGGSVTLGLLDGKMRFAFDLAAFLGEAIRWNLTTELLAGPLLAGADLPAYAVVPVRDLPRAEAVLETLEEGIVKRGCRAREGGAFSLRLEAYGLADDSGAIRAVTFEFFTFKFRLFYTLGRDALFLATQREVLERLLREGEPRPAGPPCNVRLTLYPGRWNRLRPDMLLRYEEGARQACMRHLSELRPFVALKVEEPARLLGASLSCPDGGSYGLDAAGELACSIHGTPARPRQASAPAAVSGVSHLLDGLRELSFFLRFEGDGIRTTLEVKRGE